MSAERRVKLFRNGRNQAVRIPREFEMSGEEAILRKGRRAADPPPRSLLVLLATLEPIEEAFPPIPELPTDSVDL